MTAQQNSGLPIGSKVMLSEEGIAEWIIDGEDDPSNPTGTVGEVIEETDPGTLLLMKLTGLTVVVLWNNGVTNNYAPNHLNIISVN